MSAVLEPSSSDRNFSASRVERRRAESSLDMPDIMWVATSGAFSTSLSQPSVLNSKTFTGVTAQTVAERARWSSSDISPKKLPAPRSA